MDLEEQVAIFLYVLVTNLSNRKVGERFQRSGDTVSRHECSLLYCLPLLICICLFIRCFNQILNAVTSPMFYYTYVKLPTQSTPLDSYISENPKFYPFFKGALGALNGTHISAHPLAAEHSRYCNCKGGISQNVLAATM